MLEGVFKLRPPPNRNRNLILETDLIFVKRDDVVKASPRFERKDKETLPDLQYIVHTTEKVTGLSRLHVVKSKDAGVVTPIVIKQIKAICKQLKVKTCTVGLRSDKGGEFSKQDLDKVVKKYTYVARGPHVESRNRQSQSTIF